MMQVLSCRPFRKTVEQFDAHLKEVIREQCWSYTRKW